MISAQSTPTNNEVQSIYFVGEGQGDRNISIHSRPKVATGKRTRNVTPKKVSTHSRPKAAANGERLTHLDAVSTHSRAEAAAKI